MNSIKIPRVILSIFLIASVAQAFQAGTLQETPKPLLPAEKKPVQAANAQTPAEIPQDQAIPLGDITAPPKGSVSSNSSSGGADPYVVGNGVKAPAALLPTPIANPEQARAAQEAEFEMVVPEGTVIPIILTAFLNTQSSQVETSFMPTLPIPFGFNSGWSFPKAPPSGGRSRK